MHFYNINVDEQKKGSNYEHARDEYGQDFPVREGLFTEDRFVVHQQFSFWTLLPDKSKRNIQKPFF
jgi:hypothetical protein